MLTISSLFIYPIKSLGGISLTSSQITSRGLLYDRRWMLINDDNKFISQREYPQMALCKTELVPDGIKVVFKHNDDILIPFDAPAIGRAEVTIWDDTCTADIVCLEAAEWFSKVLGVNCRLVYMPEDSRRPVDPEYAPDDKINSFSDGYPCLLIGEASLTDLSERCGEIILMDRFRPNIVFTGGAPYAEDEMAHFKINNIDFYGVKICARCPIPGIDQETAARTKEPLKTLARYRKKNNKIYMGQNLIHTGEGTLNIGDVLHILSTKPATVFNEEVGEVR
ncbi:MOSC domain-containing protein [Mucilaginibacter myungsuensis]|uniref:MOSC N-terminal beta barrel domain-containing protein n=1 Tax=Mucilaginibacter myungsuensis TaxID=649104 RepID=A0A929L015_9SPHI|nr:MOSC N-terminal beta barrel domain-containing protein [Mucilaginibacter myungsuensis]MBE9663613.1 MOSC N-terminal beta barrel domain-containing protein [Mucilaginibacter myungsuensis]MDN3599063.1 MOSC N-terminal beta barrel domain-containing protein [Mucilaginibacter myungsuensis]